MCKVYDWISVTSSQISKFSSIFIYLHEKYEIGKELGTHVMKNCLRLASLKSTLKNYTLKKTPIHRFKTIIILGAKFDER